MPNAIKTQYNVASPINAKKLGYAKKLAALHVKLEGTISKIAYITSNLENNSNEPIKLLEVNSATSASGIFPVTFGPSKNFPYNSTLIELTPKEADELGQNKLKDWPKHWHIGAWIYKKRKRKAKEQKL